MQGTEKGKRRISTRDSSAWLVTLIALWLGGNRATGRSVNKCTKKKHDAKDEDIDKRDPS